MPEFRTTIFTMKLTPTELKTIKAVAAHQGITPSQLVRDAVADRFDKYFTARKLQAAKEAAKAQEAGLP